MNIFVINIYHHYVLNLHQHYIQFNNTLINTPHFPSLKQTRAIFNEYSVDYYRPDGLKFKHGRYDEANVIHYPKFLVLTILPYKFEVKKDVVDVFELSSNSTTLILNLTYQPDLDSITYNDKWNSKDNDNNQPFQIINCQLLIQHYVGKRVFVNWPYFEYGTVCAISDFRRFYTWSNIPGDSHFICRPLATDDNQDNRNFT